MFRKQSPLHQRAKSLVVRVVAPRTSVGVRRIITDNAPIRTHEIREEAPEGLSRTLKRVLAIGVGAGLVVTALTLPLAEELMAREEVNI